MDVGKVPAPSGAQLDGLSCSPFSACSELGEKTVCIPILIQHSVHASSLLVIEKAVDFISWKLFWGAYRQPPVGNILRNCVVCCAERVGDISVGKQRFTNRLCWEVRLRCFFNMPLEVHLYPFYCALNNSDRSAFPVSLIVTVCWDISPHSLPFLRVLCCQWIPCFFPSTFAVSEALRFPSLGRKNNVCVPY